MTCFAFAGKCGALGASGLTSADAASRPSCCSNAESATIPKPPPARSRNSRRELYRAGLCSGRRGFSIDIDELVQIKEHEAEIRERAALVRRVEHREGLRALGGRRRAAE